MKAPAYLSRPHFDGADSYYARQFQVGIHPETEKHDSYFLIEPHTSIPLEVRNLKYFYNKRRVDNQTYIQVKMALQLNIKIEKSEGMEYIFKNLPTVYFPIIWFETSFEVPDMIAGALRLLINIPIIMRVASVFGIVAGLVGIYLIYRQASRNSLEPNVHKMKIGNSDGKFVIWVRRLVSQEAPIV